MNQTQILSPIVFIEAVKSGTIVFRQASWVHIQSDKNDEPELTRENVNRFAPNQTVQTDSLPMLDTMRPKIAGAAMRAKLYSWPVKVFIDGDKIVDVQEIDN